MFQEKLFRLECFVIFNKTILKGKKLLNLKNQKRTFRIKMGMKKSKTLEKIMNLYSLLT